MINVTDKAKAHILGISEMNENKIVLLGMRGGGCAGFSYTWNMKTLDELDEYSDEIIPLGNGATLAINGASLMYLYGCTIDLKQDLFGTMLEIKSPAASSACGCGESINFDMEKVEANQAKAVQIVIPE